MPCRIVPKLPAPVLPSPFSVTPPKLPQVTFAPDLCCQVVTFLTPTVPIPLGAVLVNPACVTTLREAISAMQTFVEAAIIECPRET